MRHANVSVSVNIFSPAFSPMFSDGRSTPSNMNFGAFDSFGKCHHMLYLRKEPPYSTWTIYSLWHTHT